MRYTSGRLTCPRKKSDNTWADYPASLCPDSRSLYPFLFMSIWNVLCEPLVRYLRPGRRRDPRLLPILRLRKALMRRACFRKKAFQHHNGYRHQSPGQNTIEIKKLMWKSSAVHGGRVNPQIKKPCSAMRLASVHRCQKLSFSSFFPEDSPYLSLSKTIMRKRAFKSVWYQNAKKETCAT